jgi:hypothetical protein
VDALVSIALEFSLLQRDLICLGEEGSAVRDECAEAELDQSRLPPNDELRLWVDLLLGRDSRPQRDDELPDLVLPQRLTQMPQWREALDAAAGLVDLERAIRVEVAAAKRGLTLEGWALRQALST